MLSTEDFDFDLPEELIAQTPLKDRASSRLLVVNKETGDMEDKHFHDILDELQPGDCRPVYMEKNLKQAVIWKFYF